MQKYKISRGRRYKTETNDEWMEISEEYEFPPYQDVGQQKATVRKKVIKLERWLTEFLGEG